ncbi:MAG TPA: NUDIX domain-containing protein, partial [Nitrospira sp.]|nr:NUDIX domain-containing protein [Nitrospira sp.]
EDGWDAAVRETTEEIGDLPFLNCVGTFNHAEDDGKYAYVYLCDVPYFNPRLNGETPDETQGVGWFRRKEIDELNLTPKFREDWDQSICLRDHVTKNLQRVVNESGEQSFLTDAGQELQAVGSRWPYPHRADGTEDPHYGQAPGEMGASEPPRWDDMSDNTIGEARLYPRGDEDEEFPRRRTRNKPTSRFPDQGGQQYPITSDGGPGTDVAGIPKFRKEKPPVIGASPQRGMRLVVGSVPAEAPHPDSPHAPIPEENYDPEDSVPVLTPLGNAFRRPGSNKGSGGAGDYSDPNPVDAEHVYVQMARNFPPESIQWIKRARWVGPINIPWDRIDSDAVDSWAASHQPEKVGEFVKLIRAHSGHVAPSVVIQDNDSPKAVIVDGHHRALARKKLGMPILSYLGMIDPRDRQAAEETHSKQFHSGSDPENK